MAWKNVQYQNGKFKTANGGGGGASSLTDLDDVNVSSPSGGQVLKYNSSSNKWENANESGGGGSVTDVKLDNNSVVDQNGVAQLNTPNIDGLGNTAISSPSNGQMLGYDGTTGKWKNVNPPAGSVTDVKLDNTSVVDQNGVAQLTTPNIDALGNTAISNPSNGQTLEYDSTTGKWKNTTPSSGGNVDDVKVNGTSVVDANKVAQIKSYKEVTLAEYNALPASKTSDGVLYCIKDAGGADEFPPLIYSLEEREVGVWTDGKPLYQKTIHITTIPGNNMVEVPHGISNIDKIVDIKGVLHVKTSIDSANSFTPIPRVQDNSSTQNLGIDVYNTNVRLKARGYDLAYVFDYADVTICYTKTTDSAGSGTWNTDGAYAHHYSSNEKVVGTWVDGKPIYEKTVIFNVGDLPNSSSSYITHNISNIKNVISFYGVIADGTNMRPIGCARINSSYIIGSLVNLTSIYIETNLDLSTATGQAVIQYTKTTD